MPEYSLNPVRVATVSYTHLGANYHGRFEYACIEQMELCVEILKKIVEKYAVKEI